MIPQLSVVIAKYNDHEECRQTLNTLKISIDQVHDDIEVIVVDSSIDSISDEFQWVKWIHHPTKLFAGAARNLGVQTATSDWIGFLDCGLRVEPNWVQIMLSHQSEDVDVVWGKSDFYFHKNKQKAYIRSFHRVSFSRRFIRSSMISKACFEKLNGFSIKTHAGEDIDFYQKIEKNNIKESYCDAQALYAHYPKDSLEILKKWTSFTKDNVYMKQARNKMLFIALELLILVMLLYLNTHIGSYVIVLLFQLMMLRLYLQTKASKLPLESIEDALWTFWYTIVFDLSRLCGVILGLLKLGVHYETKG
jgi:glycosyltransferase involved in cell wall biosynthesis